MHDGEGLHSTSNFLVYIVITIETITFKHLFFIITNMLYYKLITQQEHLEESRVQTGKIFCKVYYSVCFRIKDFDPIMPTFKSVLPCSNSDAP